MSPSEQSRFNQIQNGGALAVWHIELSPIENYLDGSDLTFHLPETGSVASFVVDYGFSKPNGEYYWSGCNSDGSSFRIGNFTSGITASLHVASSNAYYMITNLTTEKLILIKYDPNVVSGVSECSTPVGPDEDDDVVTDRNGCESNNIRVLILYTPATLTSASGINPIALAPLIIAELNATTMASGLDSDEISFSLAGTALLPGFAEGSNMSTAVDRLFNNTTARGLRESTFADLVLLLADNVYGNELGVSLGQTVSHGGTYSIATLTAAATRFTATHEIGHLIGARHQRCEMLYSLQCDDLTNHHGFNLPGNSGTIMREFTTTSTRAGRWSTVSGLLNIPDEFFVRVCVTETSSGNTVCGMKKVKKVLCSNGGDDRQLKIAPSSRTMTAFPVPSSDKIFISGIPESGTIAIFDLTGRLLVSQNVAETTDNIREVNISQLSNGMYFLEFSSDGLSKQKAMIVKL